jgi:hypothetical protein
MSSIESKKRNLESKQNELKSIQDMIISYKRKEEKLSKEIEDLRDDIEQAGSGGINNIPPVTKIDKTISQWGGDERSGWDRAYGVEKDNEYTFKVVEGFNPKSGGLYGWGDYIVRYGTLITGTIDKIRDDLVFLEMNNIKINAKENPDITDIEIPIEALEHVDENKRGIHIHIASSDFNKVNRRKQKHFSAEEFNEKIQSAGDIFTKVSMIEVGETYHIVLKNGATVNGKVLNADERGYITIEGQSRPIDSDDIQTITKIDKGFMFRAVKRSVKKVKRSVKKVKRSVKKVKRSRKTKRSVKKGKTRS